MPIAELVILYKTVEIMVGLVFTDLNDYFKKADDISVINRVDATIISMRLLLDQIGKLNQVEDSALREVNKLLTRLLESADDVIKAYNKLKRNTDVFNVRKKYRYIKELEEIEHEVSTIGVKLQLILCTYTDPLEVLRLAEKEAQLWQSAQIELHNENHGFVDLVNRIRVRDVPLESNYSGCRYFVDGSWKESDKFSGTGWFCTSSNGEPPIMGVANLRRSLSPLHAEVEALLWAMKCMIGADNQEVAFFTDCSDLVKMVSSPTEWPAFSVYLEEFQSDKKEFSSFSLSLISRRANIKEDNLARKFRTEPLHITYVNNIPQE
ncbi:Powdery mildew resistance protein RPW8 domain [Arabidopsis suecica]|uniref:Powdery mildew resistance protein RPW8 domain n=1 Tax=Arabidopsis suecica TaxID=45249 RepID=A0A8T2BT58_ARASU|nr:Powdery mildew resistance protein RPW8 domain [Arabidopsis suecica]